MHDGLTADHVAYAGANFAKANPAGTAVRAAVVRALTHPGFTGDDEEAVPEYDVSLVFLDRCVPPSAASSAGPIRMATQAELDAATGKSWIISGMGATSRGANQTTGLDGQMATVLQVRRLVHQMTVHALSDSSADRARG